MCNARIPTIFPRKMQNFQLNLTLASRKFSHLQFFPVVLRVRYSPRLVRSHFFIYINPVVI